MDRGSPALSTTVTVEVRVLDVNDNSPVFSKSSYSVEVSEDAAEGTQVLKVNINDHVDCQRIIMCSLFKHLSLSLAFITSPYMNSLCPGISHRC